MKWFTIGISGISCSGKTTLATGIIDQLPSLQLTDNRSIGRLHIIHQDSYFYPIDSPQHIWIPELKHINREHLGALDSARLLADVREVLQPREDEDDVASAALNILLIEGHLIYLLDELNDVCDVRLAVDIDLELCRQRRSMRRYPQPTPAGYVERYLWPLNRAHFERYTRAGAEEAEAEAKEAGGKRVHVLSGHEPASECLRKAMHAIAAELGGMHNI